MTIPASFPRRISRATSVTAPPPDNAPAETSEDPLDVASSPASWPWRRAALLGQVTHTGLFFVPALAAMTVAAVRLWRERD